MVVTDCSCRQQRATAACRCWLSEGWSSIPVSFLRLRHQLLAPLWQVAEGGWLHVFPEGRIMMNGQLGPFRWGVGKVVCDAKKAAGGRWA